jgi:ribosomal-protein-serine acetyltransferase
MEHGVSCTRDRHIALRVDSEIELRGVCVADCDELYAAIDRNRARLGEWLPWVIPGFNEHDLSAFLRQKELDNEARISLTAQIRYRSEFCGVIGLHDIDLRNRNTSIGYWLDERFAGRGIMTRACRTIVTEGFRNYNLHRIEIRCATGNRRSASVALRLGFTEEGVLRQAEWLHDRWVDLRVFGMLEHHWTL